MSPKEKNSNRFPDTRWSLLGRAASSDDETRETAMGQLLALYVPAMRSFLVASRRVPPDMIDDVLQSFVADKILARKLVHHAEEGRGRFRSYLVKSLSNFGHTWVKKRLAERNNTIEITDEVTTPDGQQVDTESFDQEWVRLVVRRTLDSMQAECMESGRADVWQIFSMRIVDPMLQDAEPVDYAEVVQRLRIETPRQAINLLVTAKRTFTRHLRVVVGQYASEKRVDLEIADLAEIVGR